MEYKDSLEGTKLLITLKKINEKRPDPIDESLLETILAIITNHPLEEERKKCQDQLDFVITQFLERDNNDI